MEQRGYVTEVESVAEKCDRYTVTLGEVQAYIGDLMEHLQSIPRGLISRWYEEGLITAEEYDRYLHE